MYGLPYDTVNRSPQPPLPERAEQLRGLYARRQRVMLDVSEANEALYRAVYEACEVEGASRRQVALVLGVGPTTVQGWIERGRQLQG